MQPKITKREKILLDTISKVIKIKRNEKNKSQRTLSYEYGLQKSFLSRIENAQNEPKLFNIWKISEALGLKPSEFFMLIEKKLPKNFNLTDI